MAAPVLLWFRQDLRLADNPALAAALARGGPVIPTYILDDEGEGGWPAGGASRWWLHHSLGALDARLRERGSRLILRTGPVETVLRRLAGETGARALFWNRRHEPAAASRDRALEAAFAAGPVEPQSFNSALLFEPPTIANRQGRPFQVFGPFWRHCLGLPVPPPVKSDANALPAPARWPASRRLEELELLPTTRWDAGLAAAWVPGEGAARARLKEFLAGPVAAYDTARDRPDLDGSSRLSPHLHFGELGPRQIWGALRARAGRSGVFPPSNGARVFLSELGWREFAHHLLVHFPRTPEQPLRPAFAAFPWAEDPDGRRRRAWERGATGYPIVDAGMRQLRRTGWMHNRVRMIAASFLVKHLRLPWQRGAAWFWDSLVDADLAGNTLGWQWSAGCGADAAPYFRVFAPVRQGRKFDPGGDYVRRWVPELARLPTEHLHAPWEAPTAIRAAAGLVLGRDYPVPIVDHATARREALDAFRQLSSRSAAPRP